MVRCEKVTKCYTLEKEKIEVLKGIDLEVEKGEFLSILGSSGSGKSTLMNILGFMDIFDVGNYEFLGRDTKTLSETERGKMRNQHIGFIFQKYHLIETYSVLQNVMMPLLVGGLSYKSAKKIALEKIEMVELSDRVKHRPSQLSGGQQQRVAIARAIATSPSLLLADEPTGALDSKTGKEILEIFKKLNADGTTIVQITHDQKVADYGLRTVKIQDGKLI